ncbi:MAG: GIY-YIG nuclease family protein [Iphinoe sp. HA4291-MV1]|jgi:hypothetical protein|nr:GIY-YIG nuclease family protein [Iphinoe sp. HA4291-MV1]
MTYQQRNDGVPGYIYLLEAQGYHGIIPGCVLRRVKIGLSRDVERRLDTLHSNQPCCDYKIIRVIYVENMECIEQVLHRKFKHCNIKLIKSREWHDLLPWQYAHVLWMFSRYDSKRNHSLSPRLITGGLVALLGVGLLVGYSMRVSTQPLPNGTTEQIK